MESHGVSWQAPGFEQVERDANWYLWSIVIAGLLVILSLWQKNILFALFILIAEILLISLGHQKQQNRVYALSADGLRVGEQSLRLFSEASGFAFFDLGGRYVELIVHPSKKFHTYVKVLVPRERVADVRGVLEQHLPTFEYHGTFSDAMARWLRL